MLAVSALVLIAKTAINVTVLPLIEPDTVLVTIVAPGVGTVGMVPLIALPFWVRTIAPALPGTVHEPVTLMAPGIVVTAGTDDVVVEATDVVVLAGTVVVAGIVVVALVVVVVVVVVMVVVGFGGGGVSGFPVEMPPIAPPKITPVVPSMAIVPSPSTFKSPDKRTGESGADAAQVPLPVNVPLARTSRPFRLWVHPV